MKYYQGGMLPCFNRSSCFMKLLFTRTKQILSPAVRWGVGGTITVPVIRHQAVFRLGNLEVTNKRPAFSHVVAKYSEVYCHGKSLKRNQLGNGKS